MFFRDNTAVPGLPFGVTALTDELYGDFVPELVTVCGRIGGNCSCSDSESLCFSRFTGDSSLGGSSSSGLFSFSSLSCFSCGLSCISSLLGLVACGPTAVLSPSVFR